VQHQVQILKYFNLSSYVCGKDCIVSTYTFFSPTEKRNITQKLKVTSYLNLLPKKQSYKRAGGVELWKKME